jgi:hypothetical protein
VDVSGRSSPSVGRGAGTPRPFVNGGGGLPWPFVGACQPWWWAPMANRQRPWWATIAIHQWWCWEYVDAGGCSSPLVGGGAGCQWTFVGRSSPFLDHDGGLRGQSPVVVSGGSWLWAVVAMCRSCDESGHSPSVDHSAGTAWPSVTGGGGPLWMLVNHGSWSPWPIAKCCGGPSSPSVGGGAGRPWTFVGSRQRSWWVPVAFRGDVRRERREW